jgi:hypothetical protein
MFETVRKTLCVCSLSAFIADPFYRPRAHRYCECFASGLHCNSCNCSNCCNNLENTTVRQEAVEATLERNPNAFRPKIAPIPGAAEDADGAGRHNKVRIRFQIQDWYFPFSQANLIIKTCVKCEFRAVTARKAVVSRNTASAFKRTFSVQTFAGMLRCLSGNIKVRQKFCSRLTSIFFPADVSTAKTLKDLLSAC